MTKIEDLIEAQEKAAQERADKAKEAQDKLDWEKRQYECAGDAQERAELKAKIDEDTAELEELKEQNGSQNLIYQQRATNDFFGNFS